MVVLVLLLLLETFLAADIFLNSDWEKVHYYVLANVLFFLAKQLVLLVMNCDCAPPGHTGGSNREV